MAHAVASVPLVPLAPALIPPRVFAAFHHLLLTLLPCSPFCEGAKNGILFSALIDRGDDGSDSVDGP